MKKLEIFNITILYIINIGSFVLIILSGIHGNNFLMTSMLITFLCTLVFIKLGSFLEVEITARGLKAKMREADNLVLELKKLAIALTKPIASSLLVASKPYVNTPDKEQIEYLKRIEQTLSEIGLNENEITEAVFPYHEETLHLYINRITSKISHDMGYRGSNEIQAKLAEYISFRDYDHENLLTFLKDLKIEIEEPVMELIEDLKFYSKYFKHRRPDKFS